MHGQVDIDLLIARFADRQHGVVARWQLLSAGASPDAVDRRVGSRRLRLLHRGVYAVGHRSLRPEGYRLAAVLACRRGALLSHAAGAAHLELRASSATIIDVTVPHTNPCRRPGIRVHRHAALRPEERTEHLGVPVTTVARTIFDLAATFPRRTLERVIDQAEVLQLFDLHDLEAVIAAHRGRPGAPLLAAVLAGYAPDQDLTRSELEEAFLALCAEQGLQRPRVNAIVVGLEVDFHWPRHRLVVEVDGWRFHRTRRAFERDRERDAILAAAGLRVLRFTARQIAAERPAVVAAVRGGLSS
ncbi:MAG TPA: DUF559 domain-containing protein [Solirubrobacteraceae bacterium]|nr:DUF559 domain-containing protein [Solirubrobacteraceae bacterium]